jgi:hypothetical protein
MLIAAAAGLLGVILGLTSAVTISAPEEPQATVASIEAAAPASRPEAPPVEAAPVVPRDTEVVSVALQVVQPRPVPLTVGELYQALARSPWPRDLWPEVVRIARCESKLGTGMDSVAEGDSGRALGVLQIRVDAHRDLARDFDLLTIDGALGAAWVLYQRSGRSFAPWSCA